MTNVKEETLTVVCTEDVVMTVSSASESGSSGTKITVSFKCGNQYALVRNKNGLYSVVGAESDDPSKSEEGYFISKLKVFQSGNLPFKLV